MRAIATGLAMFLLLASAPSGAQDLLPPDAPVVTVSSNLKELVFDWERVPNAYTYWLMEKKDASSTFTRIGERIPGGRPRAAVPLAVHLQNWPQARYLVTACNMAGCTGSAIVDPRSVMLETIGYIKTSNPDVEDIFGNVVMSSDGSTLVASALAESSNATGINGNQADNSSVRSGAVYVFRRDGRRWRQEAYLKAGVNQPTQYFGGPNANTDGVVISADGSWLAISAALQDVQGVMDAGTVYLFNRAPDGTWSQQAVLNAPELVPYAQFGAYMDMTDDGRLLKVMVGTRYDDDPDTVQNLLTHFYERQGTTWQYVSTFEPSYPDYSCGARRMSRDGKTLIAHCSSEFQIPGDLILTYKRSGNTWVKVSELFLNPTATGQKLPINYDATRMTIVEAMPDGNRRQLKVLSWIGNQWVREAVVSPPGVLPPEGELWGWGTQVKFNNAGTMMVVSAPESTAGGAGVMLAPLAGTVPHGAVYVFDRTSDPQQRWKLRSVVKAPNPDRGDLFGISLALSGSGWYLAVGAWGEDSGASGIDGDRTSNAIQESGAVYLY